MQFDQRVFAWRGSYKAPQNSTGNLAGLRLGVKDLFHIAGLPTGAGNPDWLASHSTPEHTSPVVAELLYAGANLIGKTQTDELAYSLNGLNIHYGAPVNPKTPERLPGGSSSGSAAAVAAGDIDIGLGTDTGGSIRVPASYNGLFGIRTTHGLVSSEHMVPLAPLFDTVGWLTQSADLLLKVGKVLLPATTSVWSKTTLLKVGVLAPVINQTHLWNEDYDAWLTQQNLLQETKRLSVDEIWFARASQCFRTLQGRDIWRTHGAWITQHKPTFAPDIHARFGWASQLTAEQQSAAEAERLELQQEIANWFEGVDLLLLPTTPGPAPLLGASAEWMDNYRSQLMGLTAAAGLAGLPQIHLPVLEENGAPFGISLLAPKGFDLDLLRLAARLNYAESAETAAVKS
jgi:aspartyl-tRNA(Asn)/glutamyl-tRNA(Gln) amidotransferase subunit A